VYSSPLALIPQPLLPILGEEEPERKAQSLAPSPKLGSDSLNRRETRRFSESRQRAGVRASQCRTPTEFMNLELLADRFDFGEWKETTDIIQLQLDRFHNTVNSHAGINSAPL